MAAMRRMPPVAVGPTTFSPKVPPKWGSESCSEPATTGRRMSPARNTLPLWAIRDGRFRRARPEITTQALIAIIEYCSDDHNDSLADWIGAHQVATATMPTTDTRVASARMSCSFLPDFASRFPMKGIGIPKRVKCQLWLSCASNMTVTSRG